MIVPLLKEYLEISVKNDDALIKMAGIVQRAMTSNNNTNDEGLLSDRDKELLFEEINKVQLEANQPVKQLN